MPRFYCPIPLQTGSEIELPGNVSRHVSVLRLRAGERIVVFNGDGGEYSATLSAVDKRASRAVVDDFSAREAELQHAITIAQAVPEGAKMDWIVEKSVELGAACIQPLFSRRCVVRLAGERVDRRVRHWEGIVAAASEQCGRNRLARICEPVDFASWAGRQDLHRRILLTPRATQSLAQWAAEQPPQALAIVVGPEGGFTDEEEALATAHGMLALSIGPRVLRTETAAIAALAALNGLWERG